MMLNHHLLYQKIIAHADALPAVADLFERLLVERGAWDPAARRREAVEHAVAAHEVDRADRHYAAVLFEAFFGAFSPEDVAEYIDLARKELLARRMLEYLNLDKGDPERIQQLLGEFCAIPVGRFHVSPSVTLGIRVDLISQFLSDHLPFIGIAKNHINMRDVESILDRSIGSISSPGLVGGKAAGMILANRILRPTLEQVDPEFAALVREPESFFLKSCVAVDFFNRNNLQECHSLKYLNGAEVEALRASLHERFHRGQFSAAVIQKFHDILRRTEGAPLILRSSSYLEDGVGYSFSGKYDSFFISNRGTEEERLAELVARIKDVYLSLYSAHAIEYRRDKKLLDYNERMAVLIQKVVGRAYGSYFFPLAGIVGFSRNAYCWSSRLRPEDGMLRMVFGLGTRAVDRVGEDYPRLVSLSAPTLRPEVSLAEQMKYAQRFVDVLNLETRRVETHPFVDLVNEIRAAGHDLPLADVVSVAEDGMLKTPILPPERLEAGCCAVTFEGLLRNRDFCRLLRRVLKRVEEAYGMPVDMEFAWHEGRLYVLQCRHLAVRGAPEGDASPPDVPDAPILFTARRGFASAVIRRIARIVYVDDAAYDALPDGIRRSAVARLVGRLNKELAGTSFILMGPGRWGTCNAELGVPVQYHEINNARMLIEVARAKGGVTPEASYGTHFFQDLVEADIVPLPLYPDDPGVRFDAAFFSGAQNHLADYVADAGELTAVVKVIDVAKSFGGRLLHVFLDESKGQGAGMIL